MTGQDILNDTIATILAAGTAIEEEVLKDGSYGNWKWLIYILVVIYFALRVRSEYHKGGAHRSMRHKIDSDSKLIDQIEKNQDARKNPFKDNPLK